MNYTCTDVKIKNYKDIKDNYNVLPITVEANCYTDACKKVVEKLLGLTKYYEDYYEITIKDDDNFDSMIIGVHTKMKVEFTFDIKYKYDYRNLL